MKKQKDYTLLALLIVIICIGMVSCTSTRCPSTHFVGFTKDDTLALRMIEKRINSKNYKP